MDNEQEQPAVVEVEYVNTDALNDVPDLDECLHTIFDRLASGEWYTTCFALLDLRRIAKFHPDRLTHDILERIVKMVSKSIQSPRSALCKHALMALGDLFSHYPSFMITRLDAVLLPLLLKAFQDKKFVCEESDRVLKSMALSLDPIATLPKLNLYLTHKNPRVRAKAASAYCTSASTLNPSQMGECGFERLLKVGAGQLTDQLPEARDAGKRLVLLVKDAFLRSRESLAVVGDGPVVDNDAKLDGDIKEVDRNENWKKFLNKSVSASELPCLLKASASPPP